MGVHGHWILTIGFRYTIVCIVCSTAHVLLVWGDAMGCFSPSSVRIMFWHGGGGEKGFGWWGVPLPAAAVMVSVCWIQFFMQRYMDFPTAK